MTYRYPFHNASEELKHAVWRKGQVIPGYDSDIWRRDMCGRAVKYSEHGNTNSDADWEIDHILPTSKGGKDTLDNLQPLQWENNHRKGDNYPWYCQNAA